MYPPLVRTGHPYTKPTADTKSNCIRKQETEEGAIQLKEGASKRNNEKVYQTNSEEKIGHSVPSGELLHLKKKKKEESNIFFKILSVICLKHSLSLDRKVRCSKIFKEHKNKEGVTFLNSHTTWLHLLKWVSTFRLLK